MTFIKMLKDEHKEILQTLNTLIDQDEPETRKIETLCQKLRLHMEMEESYLYPEMQNMEETREIARMAELEHKEAKKVMDALEAGKLESIECKVKLEMLQLAIEHHIEEEEKELLPKAQSRLPEKRLTEITDKMMALKNRKQKQVTGP